MKKLLLFLFAILFISISQGQDDPLIVQIGNQTWMVKNLNVDHYRNGDPIPQVKDNKEWSKLKTGAWCYYRNDSASYAATYGKLYNWYAVNDPRGLTPEGWHIPGNAEWNELDKFLGGRGDNTYNTTARVGLKMKEAGLAHWIIQNSLFIGNNSSGFTGLPGGYRVQAGFFYNVYKTGLWWSSTEFSATTAWAKGLYNYNDYVGSPRSQKQDGYSVRCLRD
jgi:uncharacterized protein (TIGR02145 family)